MADSQLVVDDENGWGISLMELPVGGPYALSGTQDLMRIISCGYDVGIAAWRFTYEPYQETSPCTPKR